MIQFNENLQQIDAAYYTCNPWQRQGSKIFNAKQQSPNVRPGRLGDQRGLWRYSGSARAYGLEWHREMIVVGRRTEAGA
jgi:hypothetical protein